MSSCGNFKETGTNTCANILRIADRLAFFPEYGSTGAKNEIATKAAVTKAALVTLIEKTNHLDQLYVLPRMDNVSDERGDVEYYEWESGKKTEIRDGIRAFVGAIEGNDTDMLGRLKSFKNMNFGFFEWDKDANFVYNLGSDLIKVEPIMVNGTSFSVKLVRATYSDAPMIMVQFDVRDDMKDENIRWIKKSALDFNGLTDDIYGLDPSRMTEVSIPIVTASTVNLYTSYDVPIEGAIAASFTMYNNTTAAAVVVTGIVESVSIPGQYVLSYASQSSSDILVVTYKATNYAQSTLTQTLIS